MNRLETCWEDPPDWQSPVIERPVAWTGRSPREAWFRIAAIGHVVMERFAEWLLRAAQRRQLARFDDRMLKDVGLTRTDAHRETRKWFWQG